VIVEKKKRNVPMLAKSLNIKELVHYAIKETPMLLIITSKNSNSRTRTKRKRRRYLLI